MVELILTPEQTQIVIDAKHPLVLRDPTGKAIGVLHALPEQTPRPQSDDEMVEEVLRRRARNPAVFTTQQVLNQLSPEAVLWRCDRAAP